LPRSERPWITFDAKIPNAAGTSPGDAEVAFHVYERRVAVAPMVHNAASFDAADLLLELALSESRHRFAMKPLLVVLALMVVAAIEAYLVVLGSSGQVSGASLALVVALAVAAPLIIEGARRLGTVIDDSRDRVTLVLGPRGGATADATG
jgi:hypothetical protein